MKKNLSFQVVAEYYTKTKSISKCAKCFGVTRETIVRLFKNNNFEYDSAPQKNKNTFPTKENIILLYTQGVSIKDIAIKFNVPYKQLLTYCKNNNIVDIKRKKFDVSKQELENLYCNHSQSDIAKLYGVTPNVVGNRLKEYNIQPRTHSETIKKYAIPKIEKTCLEKYGTKSSRSHQSVIIKSIKSRIDRYGDGIFPYTPKEENNIADFIISLGVENLRQNTFDFLDGRKQLDLYFEKNGKKYAIEYCGLYWHNELSKQPRGKEYHYVKYKLCKDKGIRLLTIFEDEWKNRNQQCRGFISSFLSDNNKIIYARRCIVREIDKNVAKDFIDATHIQGSPHTIKHSFGIFHNDILLGVMSFSPHHRINNSDILVLNRMCFATGYNIIGGASKLFSLATKKLNTNKIISWSDNRWSEGNVYVKCGFVCEKILGPDYSYVDVKRPKSRIPKQQCTRKKLGCDILQTEYEKAMSLGLGRLWDCGKIRWVWNRNNFTCSCLDD